MWVCVELELELWLWLTVSAPCLLPSLVGSAQAAPTNCRRVTGSGVAVDVDYRSLSLLISLEDVFG